MLVSFDADEITIALMATMAMLPAVVLAPIIGLVIDRINFKKLMGVLLLVEIGMTMGFMFIDTLDYVWAHDTYLYPLLCCFHALFC